MVSDGVEKVKEQVPKIQQSLENGYEKLKETGPKIKETFEQGYENLKEQAPKLQKTLENGYEKTKEGIESGVKSVKETVQENTPVEVQKTVKSGFDKIKDAGRSFLGFFKRLFGKTEEKKDEISQRFKRQFTVSYEPTGFGKSWNMNAHKFNYNKFSPYLAKKK